MADVICVGCASLDIMISGIAIHENGDLCVDFLDRIGYADQIRLAPGGDALNEATVLSRLGVDVQLVCGLGDDMEGQVLKNQLKDAGVDITGITWHQTEKTMSSLLFIQRDAERYFVQEPFSRSTSFSLRAETFDGAKVVSLASLFYTPFDTADTIAKTLKYAKDCGAVTCADVILTPNCTLSLDEIKHCLPSLDFFFPNLAEAKALTGENTPEMAARVLKNMGIGTVVIKMGENGCYVLNDTFCENVPAFHGKSIDSTGAGDSFIAGFIAAWIDGESVIDSIRFGSVTALLSIGAVGATAGIKNREAVIEILQYHSETK